MFSYANLMRNEIDRSLNDDKLIYTLKTRGYRIDVTQEGRAVWCCMVATFEKCECYRAKTRTAVFNLVRNAILSGKFERSLFSK